MSQVVYRRRSNAKGRRAHSSGSAKEADEEEAVDDTSSDESDDDDDAGSCASSAFGFMEFKTNRNASCTTLTDYESMIDYGEATGKIGGHKTSVLINRDSDGSFVFAVPTSCSIASRDSLPFHSTPIKLLVKDVSQESVVVHTSTARLMIGQIKQQPANVSQMSSFDGKLGDSHMACEDLSQLDAAKRFQNPLKKRSATAEDRHSMPTLFVGNRFNRSDRTEVYIPAYKDRMNAQLKTITSSSCRPSGSVDQRTRYDPDDDDDTEDDYDGSVTTTHSSSIDVPAAYHPAPDQITAELLYNFAPATAKSPSRQKDIIKPPSMFDTSHRISLSRELSPFKLHQLNSDKKIMSKEPGKMHAQQSRPSALSANSTRSATPSTSGSSTKRCVSHQYFKLRFDGAHQSPVASCASSSISEEFAKKTCTCCHSSECASPRSSDSGMAGSCTITSPDPQSTPTPSSHHHHHHHPDQLLSSSTTTPLHIRPNPFSPFESEFLDHLHHHQHPQRRGRLEGYRMDGDGTAAPTARRDPKPSRGAGLRHSSSSHNLGRFDVVAFDDVDADDTQSTRTLDDHTANHDSGQFGESTSLLATDDASDLCDDRMSRPRMQNVFALSTVAAAATSRDTTTTQRAARDARCQSAERLLETDPHADPRYVMQVHRRELTSAPGVYRTGLYAHWWKKVQLPGAMVRDLIVQRGNRDRRSGAWGSGKKMRCSVIVFVRVRVCVRIVCLKSHQYAAVL